MSVRNCAAIHNDARWRIKCWEPVRLRLIELGYETEHILPNLNEGGCCLFAALVGERLLKLGYRARIVISGRARLSKGHKSLNALVRHVGYDLEAWYEHGVTCITHVLLRVYGEVFDSRGFSPITNHDPSFYDGYYPGSVSIKTGLEMAEDVNAWNRLFDYYAGRLVIERLINKYMPIEGIPATGASNV